MPLIKSGSREAVHKNISEMVRAGYPQKQAVAAALATARKYGKKYAEGGPAKENEWENVERSPEGRPRINVTPQEPQPESWEPPPWENEQFQGAAPPPNYQAQQPINEQEQAQAAREAAAQRLSAGYAGRTEDVRGPTWGQIGSHYAEGMRDWAKYPGEVMAGPTQIQPEVSGQWSETDEYRQQLENQQFQKQQADWGAGTALNMIGSGRLPGGAPEGSVGIAGAPLKVRESVGVPESGQPFHSAVEQVVQRIPQEKAPAEQWLRTISNTPGVKQEELQWLGLNDWLSQKKGTVTKSDLADYIRNHKIEMNEVVRGPDTPVPQELIDRHKRLSNELDDAFAKYEEAYENKLNLSADKQKLKLYEKIRDRYENANKAFDKVASELELYKPKYETLALPNGENYKEFVLTLPKLTEKGKEFKPSAAHSYMDPESDLNRLVHIRTTDRYLNGERILNIEEMQSDLHQQGSKFGYHSGAPSGEAATVPEAPFKNTWHELAMKRLIHYAAENGYDRIAWPGSAQTVRAIEGWKNIVPRSKTPGWLASGQDVTPIINRYVSDLPKFASKFGKKYDARVLPDKIEGHDVLSLEVTPALKKAAKEHGFSLFKKGGFIHDPSMEEEHSDMKHKAGGGGVDSWMMHQASRNLHYEGMIKSPIPGRTDKIPMSVKAGSYIIPADIPSALGQGNSVAGGNILAKMFNSGPYGIAAPKIHSGRGYPRGMSLRPQRIPKGTFAEGGDIEGGEEEHSPTPIIAAGGEYVIPPEVVKALGNGDIGKGHRLLDAFVLHTRREHIKTLKKLKPPKK